MWNARVYTNEKNGRCSLEIYLPYPVSMSIQSNLKSTIEFCDTMNQMQIKIICYASFHDFVRRRKTQYNNGIPDKL